MERDERPNYYAILGVSRDAKPAEIKRRYRQLVRRFHPDVSEDKEAAHRRFVRIVEAYQVLSDPGRRLAYDGQLQSPTGTASGERRAPAPARPPTPPPPARRRSPDRAASEVRQRRVGQLLAEAERCFAQQDYPATVKWCQKVVSLDPQNAAAHALWGDAYFEQREFGKAILMYSYAVQFNPRSLLYAQKLQEAAQREKLQGERAQAQRGEEEVEEIKAQGVAYRPWITALVGLWIVGFVGWAYVDPGEPFVRISPIPLHVALSGVFVGFLVGVLLSLHRWVGSFEEELILATVEDHSAGLPVGLYLTVASLVWLYLGLVFYLIISFMQERFSWSVLKIFGATFFCLGVYAGLHPELWKHLLGYGGNLVFVAMVVGWGVGSIGQKP